MSKNVGFNVLRAVSGYSVGAERYLVREEEFSYQRRAKFCIIEAVVGR